MPWLELADLPFATALHPHPGGLQIGGDYDCAHFDKAVFDGADAADSRFLECAFTGVVFQGGELRRSRLTDVWLRDVRLTGTSLAETDWTDAVFLASAAAGRLPRSLASTRWLSSADIGMRSAGPPAPGANRTPATTVPGGITAGTGPVSGPAT